MMPIWFCTWWPTSCAHDVGLGELAGRAEPTRQRVVEAEVDVDLLVVRAVERAHRRDPAAAAGLPFVLEEHELGRLIGPAGLAEDVGPDDLGAAQDLGHELRAGIVRRRRGCRPLRLLDHLAAAAAHHAEQGERVDAEDPSGDDGDDDAADADAAPADAEAATAAAHAADVLDVAAFFLAVHAHRSLPAVIRECYCAAGAARVGERAVRTSGLGQRHALLALVLAAAILVAGLADLVALEEHHLGTALAGVDLGGSGVVLLNSSVT
jgi:hypothetical protein